jgi:hypothetical protein
MPDNREADARAEARRMLEECGVTRPDDIDLDAMAESLHAEIVYDDLDGATASVMRIGSNARIRVSNRIHDVGWQRFTVAHEFGHLRLKHEIPTGTAKEVIERFCKPLEKSRKPPERAASVFASEIVMPESLVKPYCAVPHITLAPAREIAGEFMTSVLASAMRITEITAKRCAVAYSVLGRVSWLKRSATFPNWIPHGRRVDPRSAVFEYSERGKLDGTAHVVTADVWLPRDRIDNGNVQLIEQSAVIPELGAVFTMLWIPDHEVSHLDLAA